MPFKPTLLAAAGLFALTACGVYQDYPNDENTIRDDNGQHQGTHMHDGHKHHAHEDYGHTHAEHDHYEGEGIGQDEESYMRQNDDKWMYNSCPPHAAKRGDC